MPKYEYLPLPASGRDAGGSDQIQDNPGWPGANSGNDAQVQLPTGGQPALPEEGEIPSESGGSEGDAPAFQEMLSVSPPEPNGPAVSLPVLFGGVLAALLAGAVIGKAEVGPEFEKACKYVWFDLFREHRVSVITVNKE